MKMSFIHKLQTCHSGLILQTFGFKTMIMDLNPKHCLSGIWFFWIIIIIKIVIFWKFISCQQCHFLKATPIEINYGIKVTMCIKMKNLFSSAKIENEYVFTFVDFGTTVNTQKRLAKLSKCINANMYLKQGLIHLWQS